MTGRTAVDDHTRLVLDQIQETWGGLYRCDLTGGMYHARKITGGPQLTASTPGGLAAAIWDNWTRCRRVAGYAR